MNTTKKRIIAAVVAAVALIIVVAVAMSGGGHKAATVTTPPKPSSSTSAPHKPPPAPTHKAPAERADLNYLRLDDRSQSGITDIWVKYSVTNHSSKASDYRIDWEALNDAGTRVANSTEMVVHVLPGQTATDSMPTGLTTVAVHVHVTTFDRTESF